MTAPHPLGPRRSVSTPSGEPVGVSTLAVTVGEEATIAKEVCEPLLVRAGMLARAPRGRVASPAGVEALRNDVVLAGQ